MTVLMADTRRRWDRLPTLPVRLGWILPAGILALLTAAVALLPLVVPYDHVVVPGGRPFLPPGSPGFLLGTDQVGRDLIPRVLYGLRATWFSALALVACGVVIGTVVGVIAGMRGGFIDSALMRLADLFLAVPAPILAIAIVAAIGPSLAHLVGALSIVWWAYYARIVRGEVRAIEAKPFVEAARVSGASTTRLATRHVLPGVVPVLVVTASLDVGAVIVALALLSFLGLGSPSPAPELGSMVSQGLPYLLTHSWVPLVPAIAVFAVSLLTNLCGDSIRAKLVDR
jgi:peptide/nickel transport system permease protein